MSTAALPASATSRDLLNEIRERLQDAHFVARGVTWRRRSEPQSLADQLHAIRLLAEELDKRLANPLGLKSATLPA